MAIKLKLKTKTFRTKILLSLLAISLLPLLYLAGNNLWNIIKARQQSVAELQNLAISNASAETKKFLNQKIASLNLMVSGATTAAGTPVQSIAEININNLSVLIRQVREAVGEAERIDFLDREGAALSIDSGGLIKIKSAYLNSPISDPDTLIVDQLEGAAPGSPLFQAVMSGKDYFGPVEYIEDSPVMDLASQIKNQKNEIIGAISATVKLDPIKNIINRIQLGERGFVYLVDADSRLIISSSEKFAIPGEKLLDPPLIADVIAGNSHNGLIKFETFKNALGETMVFAGRPMGMVSWSVISEWPQSDAYQVIQRQLYTSLITFFAVLIAVIVTGFLLARQITKPIKILSEGAKRISGGDLEKQIELETNDEFDALGKEFNRMIKVLKENKQLRDEFVFIAAHELRTPVTAIKGYLSMMLDGTFGKVTDKMTESLNIVYNSNERLVQLVQDLLEIARSESGKMEIKMGQVDLAAAIKSVIVELTPLAQKKNIKINYPAGGKLAVRADEYKLKELLINLIGNAVKYTLSAGEINISHETGENGSIVTRIQDHGIGISKEAMDKLFSKFYRVKTSETAKIEGTGLGLFICKEIVERMGGQIRAESEEGKGSTFSFSLTKA